MNPGELDEHYMRIALKLARRGIGATSPNPMVGALIVRNDQIVGRGYHPMAGEPHAEVFALRRAGELARGATLYVTLEPCCHYGRTPPCTDAIIKAGIARVVCSMEDPNPLVCGKGFQRLREAGIEVTLGVLEEDARKLNEVFIKYVRTRLPFVTIKAAMSIDGKIATYTGDSRWITGEKARRYAHILRAHHDAIMVGIGTVLADNPRLTVRLQPGQMRAPRNPVRVIVDTHARIPLDANLLVENPGDTIIATTSFAPSEKLESLKDLGAKVIVTDPKEGRVDIKEVLIELGRQGITSVLVEGGGSLNASLLGEGLVDKVLVFIAPKIIGGKDAITWVEGTGARTIGGCATLSISRVRRFRGDILLEAYVNTDGRGY